jgi:hypothetical protein
MSLVTETIQTRLKLSYMKCINCPLDTTEEMYAEYKQYRQVSEDYK